MINYSLRKGNNNKRLNRLILTIYFISILVLLIPMTTKAKKIYKPELADPITELWRLKSYPETKGKGIWSITEGKDGTMWFNGDDNLFVYDGLKWTLYNSENSILSFGGEFSLSPLCVTKNGEVYIGDNYGVCRLTEKGWKRVFPPEEDFKWSAHCITETSDGALWVGMEIGALQIKDSTYILYTSKKIKERLQDKAPFLQIKVFLKLPIRIRNSETFTDARVFEADNKLWVFIEDSVENHCFLHSKYPPDKIENKSSWELITEEDGLEMGYTMKVFEAKDGTIWFTSIETQKGIYLYNPARKKFSRVRELDKFGINYRTYSIAQSKDGAIWIGDWGKVLRYKEGKWKIYTSEELSIPETDIIICPTKDGSIWLGGRRQKVFKIDYTDKHWLTYKGLNFQCETDGGKKWFLTPEGNAVSNKGNKWLEYNSQDGLIKTPVVLKFAKDGTLWAAGSHNGIAATAYFKNDRWVKQTHHDLSWGIGHLAVCELQDGSMLFGSGTECRDYAGGIKHYIKRDKGEEWIHYKIPLLNYFINYTIEQTTDGTIWVGGMDLSRFDGKSIEPVTEPEGFSEPWISYLYATKENSLWVSKHGAGLYRFDGRKWNRYTVDDGLASNTISSIVSLYTNVILAATDKGLSAFDGKSWTKNIFSGYFPIPLEAGILKKDSDGYLWINLTSREWYFRGLSGKKFNKKSFPRFKTIRYRKDSLPPDTRITFGLIEIGAEGNTTISWTGKDYWNDTPSEELEFSFRLNGGEWSTFSLDNRKQFLGLKHRKHTFEVRARDTDFNIDPTPASLKFTVKAPFWKQPWFIILISSLLGIVIYQTIRVIKRNEQLKKIAETLKKSNKELKEFAYIVSHDLKEPLRGIVQLTEWTLEDSHTELDEKSKENLNMLKERTIHMDNMIQGILEYSRIGRIERKVETIDLNELIQYIIDLLAPPDNIKITVENKLPKYTADQTRLIQVFQNLLSNSIKYIDKPRGIIKIGCTEEENEWKFNISDNGPGIDEKYFDKIFKIFQILGSAPKGGSTGIGLTIVKKIIDLYEGKIWVESEIGKGTTFYFTLPKQHKRNVVK